MFLTVTVQTLFVINKITKKKQKTNMENKITDSTSPLVLATSQTPSGLGSGWHWHVPLRKQSQEPGILMLTSSQL